jgi:hypothetical protein
MMLGSYGLRSYRVNMLAFVGFHTTRHFRRRGPQEGMRDVGFGGLRDQSS